MHKTLIGLFAALAVGCGGTSQGGSRPAGAAGGDTREGGTGGPGAGSGPSAGDPLPQVDPEELAEGGAIVGRITPASALASVIAVSGGDAAAEVRANTHTGAYQLTRLTAGEYELVVVAGGFLTDTSHTDLLVEQGQVTTVPEVILFSAGTGSISGTVSPTNVDSVIAATQLGAVILETAAGGAGGFVLSGLPVGVYDLVATAPGYARHVDQRAIRVQEAQNTEVGTLTLVESEAPSGGLAGVVTPVEAEARVVALQDGVTAGSAQADAMDGSWQIDGLAVGRYDLTVRASGYVPDHSRTGVEVRPDEVTQVASVQLRTPTRSVSGVVMDGASGAPIAGAQVTVGARTAQTGGDGGYLLADPPAGTQTMQVRRAFYLPWSATLDVPAEGPAARDVTLTATGRISGQVRRADGGPVDGAIVTAGAAMSSTDPDGHFHLVHLVPGRYRVVAAAEAVYGAPVDVQVEAGEVTPLDLELAAVGDVEVTVSAAATGAPVVGAQLLGGERGGLTDQVGVATLESLLVGAHTVRVSAPGFATAERDVTVVAGRTTPMAVALEAVGTTRVEGRVTVRRTGAPAPDVSVSAGAASWRTDADGRYVLLAAPQDSSRLYLRGAAWPAATVPLDLMGRPGPVVVDVELDEWAQVFGRVTDDVTGAAIPGATVLCGSSAVADADGWYFMPNAPPGVHTCFAQSYPCFGFAQARHKLSSGQSLALDYTLARIADVVGTVVDAADERPLTGAQVRLASDGRGAVTDRTGGFRIECTPAALQTVFASLQGYSSAASQVLVPPRGETDALVRLTRRGQVPGD